MHKIRSTYKLLADRALEQDRAAGWIDWSLEMLEAGFSSEHLYILAGISPQADRFEFSPIVNKTLEELSFKNITYEEAIDGYIYWIACEALESELSTDAALDTLRNFCRELDYDKRLMPFYLLAYAKQELAELGEQYYWEGADKNNIEAIITQELTQCKNDFESRNKQ